MARTLEDLLDDLANDLNEQAADIKEDGFASFIYTADIVNDYLEDELRKDRINRTKLNILHNLTTHGGNMMPSELSRKVLRSKHAITSAIDSLIFEGLVKREGDDKDRRIRRVALTSKGVHFVKRFMPLRRKFTSQVMSCLDEDESRAFADYLKRIRQHVLSLIDEEAQSE